MEGNDSNHIQRQVNWARSYTLTQFFEARGGIKEAMIADYISGGHWPTSSFFGRVFRAVFGETWGQITKSDEPIAMASELISLKFVAFANELYALQAELDDIFGHGFDLTRMPNSIFIDNSSDWISKLHRLELSRVYRFYLESGVHLPAFERDLFRLSICEPLYYQWLELSHPEHVHSGGNRDKIQGYLVDRSMAARNRWRHLSGNVALIAMGPVAIWVAILSAWAEFGFFIIPPGMYELGWAFGRWLGIAVSGLVLAGVIWALQYSIKTPNKSDLEQYASEVQRLGQSEPRLRLLKLLLLESATSSQLHVSEIHKKYQELGWALPDPAAAILERANRRSPDDWLLC